MPALTVDALFIWLKNYQGVFCSQAFFYFTVTGGDCYSTTYAVASLPLLICSTIHSIPMNNEINELND